MTPKEADKYYGDDLAREIWENFDLSNLNVELTPDGLDIPKYEWETIRSTLI